MARMIGRKAEIEELNRLYRSGNSEFLAVYGRRRVGKTFLINEVFQDRLVFTHTGLSPFDEGSRVTNKAQLLHFYHSLTTQGLPETGCPKTWLEAFYMLEDLLKMKDNGSRQVVFIDELPWMDMPGSGLITAVEAFWNGWASARHNILLIVCGSATSWILKNLVSAKGGLYGRLTYEMKISPFTLAEVEEFFQSKEILLSRYDIAQAYMAFGGIPYYLNYFTKGKSLAQNIDQLMFAPNARLGSEFNRLFGSLFRTPEPYEAVVRCLMRRRCGFTRGEISEAVGISSGKRLSDILSVLEASDFIAHYKPFDAGRGETLYRLVDPFCRFHLYFKEQKNVTDAHYWQNELLQGGQNAWRGTAFEELCMNHTQQIKRALGVEGVTSQESAYTLRADENHDGIQCDLLIVRKDKVVNLCEMKFVDAEYAIDKRYDLVLRNRINSLRQQLKKSQTVHLTFITTYGVKYNTYSGIVQCQVTLDDLFH